MNIYRHKKTGYLYTLAMVSPRMHTGRWMEATPYNHAVPVYPRRTWVEPKDFTLVATGAALLPRWPNSTVV